MLLDCARFSPGEIYGKPGINLDRRSRRSRLPEASHSDRPKSLGGSASESSESYPIFDKRVDPMKWRGLSGETTPDIGSGALYRLSARFRCHRVAKAGTGSDRVLCEATSARAHHSIERRRS